jgi:hypothetical protein
MWPIRPVFPEAARSLLQSPVRYRRARRVFPRREDQLINLEVKRIFALPLLAQHHLSEDEAADRKC